MLRGRYATEYETLPALSRRTGIGLKTLRRLAALGAFPVYVVGTWPRTRRSETDAYFASRRASVEPAHDARVVALVEARLRRERARAERRPLGPTEAQR